MQVLPWPPLGAPLGGGFSGGFSWGCLQWEEKATNNLEKNLKTEKKNWKNLENKKCLICAFSGCFWGLLGGLLLPPWGALGGMEGKKWRNGGSSR